MEDKLTEGNFPAVLRS